MQNVIEKSAAVAYSVLGLDNKYSVKLINDPNYVEDGLWRSRERKLCKESLHLSP